MDENGCGATIISSILRHDRKVTSYKIALVRAINDVALSFPDLASPGQDVAIPLWMLAEWWIVYYWPFVGDDPIRQGPQAQTGSNVTNDMAFRPARPVSSGASSPNPAHLPPCRSPQPRFRAPRHAMSAYGSMLRSGKASAR